MVHRLGWLAGLEWLSYLLMARDRGPPGGRQAGKNNKSYFYLQGSRAGYGGRSYPSKPSPKGVHMGRQFGRRRVLCARIEKKWYTGWAGLAGLAGWLG